MPKKRINITVSPELITKLQEEAHIHCRSLSNEIEYRLMQSLTTPAYTQPTLVVHPAQSNSTPENQEDSNTHKKRPLIWLQENNIDPFDTNYDTYMRFKKVFPKTTLHEFDQYQQSRRNNK